MKKQEKNCRITIDCFLYTNEWSVFSSNQIVCEEFRASGSSEFMQEEHVAGMQLPLLPLSMTEEPAENKSPGSTGSGLLCTKGDHYSPIHQEPQHQYHTPVPSHLVHPARVTTLHPLCFSWGGCLANCYHPTLLSLGMIPRDHIDPRETDPWSMLNNPDVLTFLQRGSPGNSQSLKTTPLYHVTILDFCGASEVLGVWKTFHYYFKEVYTSSNFTNKQIKSFP